RGRPARGYGGRGRWPPASVLLTQRLVAPPEDAGQDDDPTDGADPPVVDGTEAHDHDAEAGQGREVRRGRHVDAVAVPVLVVLLVLRVLLDFARAAGRDAHEAAVLVLGVLAVPEVVAGVDHRDLGEVVLGRRRRDGPLQGAGVP